MEKCPRLVIRLGLCSANQSLSVSRELFQAGYSLSLGHERDQSLAYVSAKTRLSKRAAQSIARDALRVDFALPLGQRLIVRRTWKCQ
jgi:hypothetical protein